jgi:hypothetical protein
MTARIYSLFGSQIAEGEPQSPLPPIPHAGLARLLALWQSWAAEGLPSRDRIQPEILRPWLGHLAIIELSRLPFRARYRLVGTALTALAGSELTGRYVDELYSRRIRREVMKAYAEVVDSRQPHYRHMRFWLTRRTFGYYRLILPFSSDGRGVDVCLLALYPDRPDIIKASDWQDDVDRAELAAWFPRKS